MPTGIPIGSFYAVHRGGGPHSVQLNQRGAAVLAHFAARIGLHPAVLTLSALVLGGAAGIALAIIAPVLPEMTALERGAVALIAWLALQAAYSLDCADGQLARVTGTASADGGTLDLMCDVLVQAAFAAALATAAVAFHGPLPAWEASVWGSAWIAALVTSQAAKDGRDMTLIRSRHPLVQAVKVTRDYGAQITAACVLLAVWPDGLRWLLWTITAANLAAVTGIIIRTAKRSMTPLADVDSNASDVHDVSAGNVPAQRLR